MQLPMNGVFQIKIFVDRNPIRLVCTCLHKSLWNEQWQVAAWNKTLVLETNRHVLEKRGLKHRRWDWHLLRGELSNIKVRNDITLAMEYHLKGIPPPQDSTTPFGKDKRA